MQDIYIYIKHLRRYKYYDMHFLAIVYRSARRKDYSLLEYIGVTSAFIMILFTIEHRTLQCAVLKLNCCNK